MGIMLIQLLTGGHHLASFPLKLSSDTLQFSWQRGLLRHEVTKQAPAMTFQTWRSDETDCII